MLVWILVEVLLSLIYPKCNMDDALANASIMDIDHHAPEQLIRDQGMLDLTTLMINRDISTQDTEKPQCTTNQIVINKGHQTKIEKIRMISDTTIRIIITISITIDIVILNIKMNIGRVIVCMTIIIIIQAVLKNAKIMIIREFLWTQNNIGFQRRIVFKKNINIIEKTGNRSKEKKDISREKASLTSSLQLINLINRSNKRDHPQSIFLMGQLFILVGRLTTSIIN